MRNWFTYGLSIIWFGITSCEDTIDANLDTAPSDLLVVEGILTNQNINHRIKLTHPHQEINGIPVPATGATVIIGEGSIVNDDFILNDTIPLLEFPPGSGEYYTEPFRAVFGRVYGLNIEYQGNTFFAVDTSEPAEPLPPLILDTLDTGEVPFFRLRNSESGSQPNFINHFITWENSPVCAFTDGCEGKVVFYDLKTVDVHQIFPPDKTDFPFPIGSVIVRTKYSVNERYRTFLRSVLSETEWRGSLFDIQRANTPTNLSEGAIGFFAVSTVVSDTTLLQ